MEKRWVNIFKALGNINRLKIVKMLANDRSMTVTEISESLGISLKATSRHLIIFQNFELLESEGKQGFVYYRLNKNAPNDFKKALKLFC